MLEQLNTAGSRTVIHNEQSASSPPLVSIIIPTHNYGHFVVDAINSAITQKYSNCEVIVVDDGSTDNTNEIIGNRIDITYIRQNNQGLSAARNSGMRAANGKYLQFLDADDLLGDDSIVKRVEFLERHPEFSFVVCRSTIFKGMLPPKRAATARHEWRLPRPEILDLNLSFANIAPPHAFLTRKVVVDQLNLRFDTALRACEDYDFWIRLAVLSSPPALLANCRVYYRQHAASMSKSYTNQFRHDAVLCRRVLALLEREPHWLGNRPQSDYLIVMLASSLRTARRLWHLDRENFSSFYTGHVLSLAKKLTLDNLSGHMDIAIYCALIRLSASRLRFNDDAIDDEGYSQLAQRFSFYSSYFGLGGLEVLRHGRIRECFHLILYDLHFLTFVSLRKYIWPRRKRPATQ